MSNYNIEELELILSFKSQLNDKIEQFHDISKAAEKKEKEILDFNVFYINEKKKCEKQLDELKSKIKKNLKIFNELENKIAIQQQIVDDLEKRLCCLKRVTLIERNYNN